ncbi:hypothetical protein [Methanosphaera sp. WGK6]|uniref:hypothetical protein n=1 Tax=Methanosphaera sp. WGK6 TaxID=1561964 RepID=UPI00084BC635|nr:hypothetical protein [Methanosphaera sp. WGK6]OED29623.1 hypothetical protein NL43_07430 [Methanosphaera sp. WGK6]
MYKLIPEIILDKISFAAKLTATVTKLKLTKRDLKFIPSTCNIPRKIINTVTYLTNNDNDFNELKSKADVSFIFSIALDNNFKIINGITTTNIKLTNKVISPIVMPNCSIINFTYPT